MSRMSREEHLQWAKRRALQYLDAGDLPNAFASMCSDIGKHPECAIDAFLAQIGLTSVIGRDDQGLRRWIEGFCTYNAEGKPAQ